MSKSIKTISIFFLSLLFLSAVNFVFAADDKLTNPLCGGQANCTLPSIIGRVIKNLMGLLGSIALVMFLYGGFLWLTAAGNETKVTKGKDTLIWAALGLVLIFASYSLVNFIFTALTNK